LGTVFKQSFKYLKNGKIIFIKMLLKLECLFYQNIYICIYYFILFYIRRAILTQTNAKTGLIEKKHTVCYLLGRAYDKNFMEKLKMYII